MALMRAKGREYVIFLISEMNPAKMASLHGLDAFVQIACPRLSIDWGEEFERPVLTPYEAEVALDNVSPWWLAVGAAPGEENSPYPMDYYARDGGTWSSSYHKQTGKNGKTKRTPVQIEQTV
uniref:Diphthamide biosynthesis protein 1 n=1 Tax=Ostreococcus mediterraneus TaxID=1486918 RepID=A0A7S2VY39_9CHLO|mmetsp:Transcript_754/g.1081  ORF Transcript_754/g.1081 Transcript_754/m.1081 type:complete len:122 (+) Transcript_754:1-366(+)